jgi:glycosyltransferase involved in cell wall biosynthesis
MSLPIAEKTGGSNLSAPELSIVLPCYNEQANLASAVTTYYQELAVAGFEDCEIIVVNDASTDRTGELADELAQRDPRLRVVHHDRNQGQSAAILNGFRAARGRVLTHNGIDLPFHPRDVARMLALIREGADVVVVERSNRQAYNLVRKVISWCNILLLRLLFGSPFADHNFVQFYRREVFEAVPVLSRGVSTVTAELIFRALGAGFQVQSCPAEYHARQIGCSTITPRKVLYAVVETFRLWWLTRPGGLATLAPLIALSSRVGRRGALKSEVPG